eukprot:241850-Chlamydomonas_euryale.AAC.2
MGEDGGGGTVLIRAGGSGAEGLSGEGRSGAVEGSWVPEQALAARSPDPAVAHLHTSTPGPRGVAEQRGHRCVRHRPRHRRRQAASEHGGRASARWPHHAASGNDKPALHAAAPRGVDGRCVWTGDVCGQRRGRTVAKTAVFVWRGGVQLQ